MGTKAVEVNGFTLWIRTEKWGDIDIANEVLKGDVYQLQWLRERCADPGFILDVGGHIGCFTMLAHSYWPDACYALVEPNPRSVELVVQNVGDYATVIEASMRYDEMDILLDSDDATGGGFMIDSEKRNLLDETDGWMGYRPIRENTPLVTLESVLEQTRQNHIDILKFDCEGSENNILRNARRETLRQTDWIVGEYHAQGLEFHQLLKEVFPGRRIMIEEKAERIGLFRVYPCGV